MRTRSRAQVLVAIALAVMVAAGASAAVKYYAPIKGATYKGTLKIARASSVTFPISFKVSANGKGVSTFKFSNGYPVYCQGGGFGQLQPASGSISKGKFSVKLPIYFAPGHAHQGFVIVTGRFGKNKTESGAVRTAFTHATVCNGTSTYTTKG